VSACSEKIVPLSFEEDKVRSCVDTTEGGTGNAENVDKGWDRQIQQLLLYEVFCSRRWI
jgi:hypothetical protein